MAGERIAYFSAPVIRGMSIPFDVETTSSMEELSGIAPVALMPIFWANPEL